MFLLKFQFSLMRRFIKEPNRQGLKEKGERSEEKNLTITESGFLKTKIQIKVFFLFFIFPTLIQGGIL